MNGTVERIENWFVNELTENYVNCWVLFDGMVTSGMICTIWDLRTRFRLLLRFMIDILWKVWRHSTEINQNLIKAVENLAT
jgi:hypothetical protein